MFINITYLLLILGEIKLNKIDNIKKVPIDTTTICNNYTDEYNIPTCINYQKYIGYTLTSSSEVGDILLLYNNTNNSKNNNDNNTININNDSNEQPQIWFMDLSNRLHFISYSFTNYLRLEIIHLGIYYY